MSEATILEQMFIDDYKAIKKELDSVKKELEDLRQKKLSPEEAIKKDLETPLVFKTFSKHCCYLKVDNYWSIERCDIIKPLKSYELKELIEDDDWIKKFAHEVISNRYGGETPLALVEKTFPYTACFNGTVVLFEFNTSYTNGVVRADCSVLRTGDNFELNEYYDISVKEKLYEFGLKKLKHELSKVYKNKLEEEKKQ